MFKQVLSKLAFVFLCVFCGVNINATSLKVGENDIVLANYRDIRDLNPHLYSGEIYAQNLIFESLIRLENDGSFSPWLAKSYEISKDGKTYTFTLRDDVYFTDGVKFDAKIAKANFDALLDNIKRHGWLESVRLMKKYQDESKKEAIEAKGDKLMVHLAEPYYPFLIELSTPRPFRFLSPNSFIDGTTKNGISSIIGTGAYKLSENKIDQYAVFERNDKYWGQKPKIEKIIVKVIPDAQIRTLALRKGEIDLIFGGNMIDTETFQRFGAAKGFKAQMSKPVSTRMLILNTTKKALKDLKVRQALMHATDKQKISKGLFSGLETPANSFLSPSVPYANVGLKPYEFSFKKANDLLESAGWKKEKGETYRRKDGKLLEIALNYDTNKVIDQNLAVFLQSEYKKIGLKLKLLGEEEQAYRDRMNAGDFDFAFYYSWGTPYDPQSSIGSMRNTSYADHYAQAGLEKKKELDQKILEVLKTTDEKTRQEYYKNILEYLHEQSVYLPLTYQNNLAVYNEKVKNVTFNLSFFEYPIEKMYIQK